MLGASTPATGMHEDSDLDNIVSQDDILDWNTAKAKLKPTKKAKSAGHVLGLSANIHAQLAAVGYADRVARESMAVSKPKQEHTVAKPETKIPTKHMVPPPKEAANPFPERRPAKVGKAAGGLVGEDVARGHMLGAAYESVAGGWCGL